MTFSEIDLYEAIYDVRAELERSGRSTGSDGLLIDLDRREELCRMIQFRLPIGTPYSAAQMVDAWVAFRKRSDGKALLVVEIARSHGRQCFWKGRGLGNCSDDVSIDRLLPGSRGGLYTVANCVLACGTHNSMRRDRTIEEFLGHSVGVVS
jgi:hypothetical protein